MRLVVSNIEQFKVFFDVVYDVASEMLELKFYTDHLTCAILDNSRTRFFYVEYEMKFFDEYDMDEVSSVCIFLEDIYKLLKLANKTDTLTLEFSDEIMSAEFKSPNGNKRFFEFTMPYDEFMNTPSFPQVDLPSDLNLIASDLEQSVKDIELVGTDVFQFVLAENSITLMSDTMGDFGSHSSTRYAQVIDCETNVTQTLQVRFNLTYIKQMLKFKKINNEFNIKLGDLALVYCFADEIMGVTVRGMIAPRIVED